MARRTNHNAISLFPFLAVLVCTMGALILLLLVTTRRIRHDLVAARTADVTVLPDVVADDEAEIDELPQSSVARQPDAVSSPDTWQLGGNQIVPGDLPNHAPVAPITPPDGTVADADDAGQSVAPVDVSPVPDAPSEAELAASRQRIEELQQTIAQRKSQYEQTQLEIDRVQARLPQQTEVETTVTASDLLALQQQESQLRENLQLRNRQIAELTRELETVSEQTERAEQVLTARQSDLVSLRKIVQEADQEPADGGATLLEFSNSTGTQRIPIVIDISDRGFEFLPSGVVLTSEDMAGFPLSDNPLLSGISAVHRQRSQKSVTAEPYVLLLVRPGGSMPFYSAQKALTKAGIHFGYELMEPDRAVTVDHNGPDEVTVLRQTIAAAHRRRDEMYGDLFVADMRPQAGDRQSPREMRVLPDGRVVTAQEQPEAVPGRFYAGGTAPPADYLRRRQQRSGNNGPSQGGGLSAWDRALAAREQQRSRQQTNTEASDEDSATDDPDFFMNTAPEADGSLPELVTDNASSTAGSAEPPATDDASRQDDTEQTTAGNSPQSVTSSQHSNSSERSDRPDSVTTDPEQDTRTVGSPKSLSVTTGTQTAPARPTFSDPVLSAMLRTARLNDPARAGYHPITVTITRTTLVVEEQPPVDLTGLNQQQVLNAAVAGIREALKQLPADERAGAAATVSYIVGVGGGPVQRRLADRLKRMDVPTRTITYRADVADPVSVDRDQQEGSGSGTSSSSGERTSL